MEADEVFKKWIFDFHRLRIAGFIDENQKRSIWKRICKRINDAGYRVEDVGFYEYNFEKIETARETKNGS